MGARVKMLLSSDNVRLTDNTRRRSSRFVSPTWGLSRSVERHKLQSQAVTTNPILHGFVSGRPAPRRLQLRFSCTSRLAALFFFCPLSFPLHLHLLHIQVATDRLSIFQVWPGQGGLSHASTLQPYCVIASTRESEPGPVRRDPRRGSKERSYP